VTLVAVDWGTSSLRGVLLDDAGKVLDTYAAPLGILAVPPGQFASIFVAHFAHWMRAAGDLCLISGMAGSRQGWQEAPYCPCPAGFADVASALAWIEPGRIALVPGLCCEREGVPDVMRGEETQVLGALALLGLHDAELVLPGTHSKWVTVRGGRIERFRTFMTGEFYALLRQHSILARTLPAEDGELDVAAFERGVAHAGRDGSLLSAAFSARTLALFDKLPAAAQPSYLSGLLIGEELRAQNPGGGSGTVVVIGSEVLTSRYRIALAARGVAAQCVGEEATWRGLHAIAAGLKGKP
jgi:2-dehydro-3-deoxygalactonokinase